MEFTRQCARRCLDAGCNLNMATWHHECGTAHCVAGWIVIEAGRTGQLLERLNGTPTAAALLCPSLSHLFYETDPERMDYVLSELRRVAGMEEAQTGARA